MTRDRKQYSREYYLKNHELCLNKNQVWLSKNKERHKELMRLWWIKNREKRLEPNKLYMREKRKSLSKEFVCQTCGKKYFAFESKLNVCSTKCRYGNKEFVKKLKSSVLDKPNKWERKFFRWLNKNIKGTWEYTGDFSFWIKNKNPDFVDKNRKIAIELFGDYWHKLHIKNRNISKTDYEQEYYSHYSKNDWKLFIVWFSEFKSGVAKEKLIYDKVLNNCVRVD